ncbi:unnamed protein product [Rhizophagus irregularis]|nr:unnamed protein product [Rhizophagus irregularis]
MQILFNSTVLLKKKMRKSIRLSLNMQKGIVHGDLHPNNILVHKDTIKLADFGRSFETGKGCDNTEVWGILSGVREEPVPNTNVKFIGLYQKCWEQEPDERSNISEVNETLSSIDSENNNVPTVPYSKGSEESEKTEFEHSCQIDYVGYVKLI